MAKVQSKPLKIEDVFNVLAPVLPIATLCSVSRLSKDINGAVKPEFARRMMQRVEEVMEALDFRRQDGGVNLQEIGRRYQVLFKRPFLFDGLYLGKFIDKYFPCDLLGGTPGVDHPVSFVNALGFILTS